MAYVNVADWKPDQVTDWLKGLDSSISPYIQSFLNNHVTGQQLLNLGPDDLEHLGIIKIGLQEIILEGVEHLRSIHYELDRENLQLLAMRLSCLAHSLHNELYHCEAETQRLCPQILADIANIVSAVKPLISWLDRPGFQEVEYAEKRRSVLRVALNMATCGQRDRFAEAPSLQMRVAAFELAELADYIVREIQDPLILQPASLDLATIKKRSSDDLGFYIVPSSRRVHQISELKLNGAAHQSGKIEPGDEIIQINYQTVVGWEVKHVMGLFAECPTEVLLTLKKRPRHTKVYGQIYVKPYRLPSKKRSPHPFSRHLHLTPLRIHLQPLNKLGNSLARKIEEEKQESRLSSSSDEEVTVQHHNLGVPANPVHRRATITGASPLSKRPPLDIRELWHDLKLEKESSSKKSTSSIIDFEDRLNSSSFVKDEPLEMETKDIAPRPTLSSTDGSLSFEKLSIKQKIKIFSCNEDAQSKPKNVSRPVKPVRVNSSPVFEDNILKHGVKVKCNEKDISQFVSIKDLKSSQEIPVEDCPKPEPPPGNFMNLNDDDKTKISEVSVIIGQGCNMLNSESDIESNSSFVPSAVSNITIPSYEHKEINITLNEDAKNIKPVIIEDQAIVKEKLDICINNFKEDNSKEILINNQCVTVKIPVRQNSKENVTYQSKPCSNDHFSIRNQISDKSLISIKNNWQQADPNPLNNKVINNNLTSGPSRSEFYVQDNREPNLIVNYPVNYLSKELNDDKRGKVPEESNVEHGRVVETINRHLLDNLNDYSDFNCGGLETLSSSLPHHGRLRKGIVFDDNRPEILTNSLPLLKRTSQQQREFASELSRTISQVYRDDASVSERSYDPTDYGFPVWQCSNEPFQKSTFISEAKHFSSGESLNKKACEKPELNRSFTSLHEWTPKDTSSETSSCKSLSSDFASDATKSRITDLSQGPPLPPPRPSLSKPPSACYRAIIAARSIGKSSPKAQRKKNPLLAKGRKISVKEISRCYCEGWLQQRCRKGSSLWKRRWCLISSNTLYTYVSKQSEKAETMICLPGFTVSPANEVKSRSFAFKVYHDGTSFYFAADSYMEFSYWVDAITVATLAQSSHSREIAFSESEGEEECSKQTAPIPAPRQNPPPPPQSTSSGSQQSSHSLTADLPKKFGSLKKLACRGSSDLKEKEKEKAGGSSLDRKCRRLLGVGSPQPVPTPQYRSYRRVHHTPPPPPNYPNMGQMKDMLHQSTPPQDMADYRQTSYQPKTPPIPRRRTVPATPDTPPMSSALPHNIAGTDTWEGEQVISGSSTLNPSSARPVLAENVSGFHFKKKTKKPSQPPPPF